MYSEEGKRMVARVIISYLNDGVDYHAAWSRYLMAADLIISDAERKEIDGIIYEMRMEEPRRKFREEMARIDEEERKELKVSLEDIFSNPKGWMK